jgi:DDE superfamily endonuclease
MSIFSNLVSTALFMYVLCDEEERRLKRRSWKDKYLNAEGKRRRDRRYPRISLKSYSESPFKYLYDSGNDQSLLNACGVDHQEFTRLLQIFQPLYDKYTFDENTGVIREKQAINRGRPRTLDAIGCLGLVLLWYRTKGATSRTLSLVFGITNSPMERFLRFGKLLLYQALHQYRPQKPSGDKIEAYVEALKTKYPHAENAGFACDGIKFPIQSPTGDAEQAIYYNGWTRGHYISCIFVFAPDGAIPICALNAPGCLHDSTVAWYGGVYQSLEDMYNTHGVRTVVDSAFQIGTGEFLLKSAQLDPDVDPEDGGFEKFLENKDATSIRQLSEWGMHQLKSKFPRMNDTIKYETRGHRLLDLSLMVRLYNHQCVSIGMNQILNTYMPGESREYQYFDTSIVVDDTGDEALVAMAAQV